MNQARMLRLLLLVSIVLIIAGVVRCSVEMTRPAPGSEEAELSVR